MDGKMDGWMDERMEAWMDVCMRVYQSPSQSLTELMPPPPASFRSDDESWLKTPLTDKSAEAHDTMHARGTVRSNFILREAYFCL